MVNNLVALVFKKGALLLTCGALLFAGSAMLFQQAKVTFFDGGESERTKPAPLNVTLLHGQASDIQGAFPVDSVDNYTIERGGKDAFSLLLAYYKDDQNQQRRAVLFPKGKQEARALPSPTGLRQAIWQDAAKAISENTPKDALILSWWDDGQRIHFLSGRDAWVNKPAEQTFVSPIWKHLQDNLLLASDSERNQLSTMARWLTMDSDKALAEIKQTLGTSRPIYLLVTNDLLMRLGEIVDYGGKPLAFSSKTVQAHDNLHGDIAQIKQWAYEEGDGNYLVQKEDLAYHVWATAKGSGAGKNALVVRLLPFVDSLKKLPEKVHLVYQSHWGGYLSIYKLELD
ncbi:hydroxylamine oxidation protein HaoB [Methyloglobulus sp.]|uniref:hydroxylamine oxidation protein HaoB n=1 Tax=Methyloglobulus sp. TaxID=2518622 RepID=UPI0032B7D539